MNEILSLQLVLQYHSGFVIETKFLQYVFKSGLLRSF